MEIPLKSRPKVSTVNLLDESNFELKKKSGEESNSSQLWRTGPLEDANQGNTKLDGNQLKARKKSVFSDALRSAEPSIHNNNNTQRTRRFSETERNNFDSVTGHRIYEDGKIRPQTLRQSEGGRHGNSNNGALVSDQPKHEKLYSRSHDSNIDVGRTFSQGIEDEYIPGFDFSDAVYKWNNGSSSDLALGMGMGLSRQVTQTSTSGSHTPRSNNASYLDLNLLHAQVAPQPIKSGHQPPNISYAKLHEYMRANRSSAVVANESDSGDKTPRSGFLKGLTELTQAEKSKRDISDASASRPRGIKKLKSAVDTTTGEVNYEMILNSLPPNFNELPYSQRKKLVRNFSDNIDYSQFSLFAKNYHGSFGSVKTPKSGGTEEDSTEGSFSRNRSRHGSCNTLAGRLLARTSTTDMMMKRGEAVEETKIKQNVDERGAYVLGYELGKIIGFGAWGTIRECTDAKGDVKAVKIVRSCRLGAGAERRSPSRRGDNNHDNENDNDNDNGNSRSTKVLQVFKKEIGIWKQLKHENILSMIDYLETDDTIFCIMNRINGGTLFELVTAWGPYNSGLGNSTGPIEFSIQKQSARLQKVVECTRQIVGALLYMHEEKGIVHGDLKLENVLVEMESEANEKFKMILCDFGMSRIFDNRVSRKSSTKLGSGSAHTHLSPLVNEDNAWEARSKSSNTELRKPFKGGDTPNTKHLEFLTRDDLRIGSTNIFKIHGPSLQSVHLTPIASAPESPSTLSLSEFSKNFLHRERSQNEIDSKLPHSHIGSLPYASPELLQPAPPPLGPSADVWALGVLVYAMCVGRLPFQHQYEPRLRTMITAGQFNEDDLKKACLLEWVLRDCKSKNGSESHGGGDNDDSIPAALILSSPSMVDVTMQNQLNELQQEWREYNKGQRKREFEFLHDIVLGCLETNITKRWDMQMIHERLKLHA
ncbi:uncharacterized protein LODBEIA_P45950 [Lodderomyces beijingensis]|uniref:Protein kinase domain-containing protein n=1 Tax=Lodderomyces beijingensis TaxID=1775926 RepID=A0ABP0ZTC8_9ASCO